MIDPTSRRVPPPVSSEPIGERAGAAPTGATGEASLHRRDSLDASGSRGRSPVDLAGGRIPSPLDLLQQLFQGSDLKGPRLSHIDQGWTPQGQGHDATRGEVLSTYYDESGVLLSAQDKGSGRESLQVRLGGLGPDAPGGAVPSPSHGGGVSTDGDRVYVADTHHIYVYSREALERAAADGAAAEPLQAMPVPRPADLKDPNTGIGLVSSGSYMTVNDGYAYVGAYSKDGDGKAGALWRFTLNPETGGLVEGSREGPLRTPDRAQGVAVVDGGLLFTTGAHELHYQPFTSTADTFAADITERVEIGNGRIAPYAQGLNVVDGELWVTYESGSDKYRDKVAKPREHIQRIPLDELDLAAAGLTKAQLAG